MKKKNRNMPGGRFELIFRHKLEVKPIACMKNDVFLRLMSDCRCRKIGEKLKRLGIELVSFSKQVLLILLSTLIFYGYTLKHMFTFFFQTCIIFCLVTTKQ